MEPSIRAEKAQSDTNTTEQVKLGENTRDDGDWRWWSRLYQVTFNQTPAPYCASMTLMMMTMVLTIMMMLIMMHTIGEVCPYGQHADNLKKQKKQNRNGQSNLTTEFLSHTDGFAPYTQFNPQCSKLKLDHLCSPWWDWEHRKHPWGDSGLLFLLTHIAGQSCNNDSTAIKSSKAPEVLFIIKVFINSCRGYRKANGYLVDLSECDFLSYVL